MRNISYKVIKEQAVDVNQMRPIEALLYLEELKSTLES